MYNNKVKAARFREIQINYIADITRDAAVNHKKAKFEFSNLT